MLITPPPLGHRKVITFAALAAAFAVSLATPASSASSATRSSATSASATRSAATSASATSASSASTADPDWLWPVDPPHSIVRPFIAPQTAYSAGHRGIDIAAVDGSPIRAPAAGVVSFAGVVVNRPVLSITYGGGLISSFEPVTSALVAGTAVARGTVVGSLAPGHCALTCLHFGVRLNGRYVSPLNYLGGIQRPVLLPTRTL